MSFTNSLGDLLAKAIGKFTRAKYQNIQIATNVISATYLGAWLALHGENTHAIFELPLTYVVIFTVLLVAANFALTTLIFLSEK